MVEYQGAVTESYVPFPSDPAEQESKLTFKFHDKASFLLGSTVIRLAGAPLIISGGLTVTSASKNQTNCAGTFSARLRVMVPLFVTDAAVDQPERSVAGIRHRQVVDSARGA